MPIEKMNVQRAVHDQEREETQESETTGRMRKARRKSLRE
jgi:hypothetical protein